MGSEKRGKVFHLHLLQRLGNLFASNVRAKPSKMLAGELQTFLWTFGGAVSLLRLHHKGLLELNSCSWWRLHSGFWVWILHVLQLLFHSSGSNTNLKFTLLHANYFIFCSCSQIKSKLLFYKTFTILTVLFPHSCFGTMHVWMFRQIF